MIRKLLLLVLIIFTVSSVNAQTEDIAQLQETAKTYTRQGDFANAISTLNKAYQLEPSNREVGTELAYNYFLRREYDKARETIDPILDKDDLSEQVFVVGGNIYKALNLVKEGEKIYKRAIKKYKKSGTLYNDYGELLAKEDVNISIRIWEKGIEVDPNFAGNYYHATKYYYSSADKIWSLIYGEIFINLESLTGRTVEMKSLLLEAFRKILFDQQSPSEKNLFTQAISASLSKQKNLASSGLNPETLTMIRTRFILDWNENGAKKFPHKLFEYHQQLLRDGMFSAYNQWLFGIPQNLMAYQRWTSEHTDEYNEFSQHQKSRIFRIPEGQFYHVIK